MAKLSTLQKAKIRTFAIPFGDEVVNVEVNITAFTLGWQGRYNAAVKDDDLYAIGKAFFEIVTKWDVEDDDGHVLPLDDTSIGALTMRTFIHMVSTIMDELDPNDLAPQESQKR